MKKQLTLLGLAGGFLLASFTVKTTYDKCDDCEYDLEFVKTINNGDDSKYDLKCKKTGNHYDVYKRKNGNWESQMSSKQYSDKCDLVKYLCDCK